MLSLSCFICDAPQDPYNVCNYCGYPMCPTCGGASDCYHCVASPYRVPKRLKGRDVDYQPAQITCHFCTNSICMECYNENAIRFKGIEFNPTIGWKYTREINRKALDLFLLNNRLQLGLPKEILLYVISYL